jgi:hypothetical protein
LLTAEWHALLLVVSSEFQDTLSKTKGGIVKLAIVLLLGMIQHQTQAAYTFDPNVPTDIQTQMRQDLDFIVTVKGQTHTPLHEKIYGSLSGANYSTFFTDRIFGIGMSQCGSPNAVACVYGPGKMFITNNYIKFSHPAIARLMIVFHEARHAEVSRRWAHANCPVPFRDVNGNDIRSIWTGALLEGQDACDETPYGSYGSTTIMLKNISKHCTSCNEKVKMDAGIYADDQFKRITDVQAQKEMKDDLYN